MGHGPNTKSEYRQASSLQPMSNSTKACWSLDDEGEEGVIRGALERAGYGQNLDRSRLEELGFFACIADLEEELIRAVGETILSRLIELEGDAQPWHTFRKQHAWQDRPVDQQIRRFIRSVSERNGRYIRAIVETIDPSRLPRPLRLLKRGSQPSRGLAAAQVLEDRSPWRRVEQQHDRGNLAVDDSECIISAALAPGGHVTLRSSLYPPARMPG